MNVLKITELKLFVEEGAHPLVATSKLRTLEPAKHPYNIWMNNMLKQAKASARVRPPRPKQIPDHIYPKLSLELYGWIMYNKRLDQIVSEEDGYIPVFKTMTDARTWYRTLI